MTRAENSGARSARVIIWVALSVVALGGLVGAIATASWWALLAVAGLALPMMPIRSSAARR